MTDKLIKEVIALNDHFNPSLVEGQDELCIVISIKLKINHSIKLQHTAIFNPRQKMPLLKEMEQPMQKVNKKEKEKRLFG